MPRNAIEIQGTLREDGTLVLDQKPDLPPGRVKVTVQTVLDYTETEIGQFFEQIKLDYTETEIGQFFEQIKSEREALGIPPRSPEEIDSYLATMRDDDKRCQLIEQIQEECRRQRERQQPPEAE